MPKGAGKGKISNDLVAASCAAVLAVYAAGYTRTRDAARKFETQAEERRLAARQRPGASAPQPAEIVASAPALSPRLESGVLAAPALAITARAPPSAAIATPKVAHHSTSSATPTASGQPQYSAAHEPATRTTAPAVSAESGSSPASAQQIAPVPLPSEIASASTPVSVTPEAAATPAAKWRDGVYTGVGDSPHGDIEARVVIKNGRIVEAGISVCDTRYPCSVIDTIIHQPIVLQSPTVDYVSHATESSYAYYYGLVDALKQALEQPAGEAESK